MPRDLKIVSSRTIYQNPYIKIIVDTLATKEHQWEQAYFERPNKNGVGVIPIDKTGIYLVKQYRHATREDQWQYPMGVLDFGRQPLEMAKIELREEAGLIAKKWTKLGSFIGNPGMSSQETFLFLAEDFVKTKSSPEKTEVGMQAKHFTFKQISQMVRKGQIKCGFTLSGFMLLKSRYPYIKI